MAAPIQFAQVGVQPQIVYQQPQVATQQHFIQKKRFAGEDQCKLFVGGLNYDTSDDVFTKYFEGFGEVIDSIIMIDKQTNKPRGFGFVTFKNAEDMEKCLAHEGQHILDDRRVDIKRAVAQGQLPKEQFEEKKLSFASSGGDHQFKGPMKISSELKVFVGGIAPGTDEADVQKYFEDFGTVVDVNMPKDHITHNYRGFGFVGFETPEVVAAVTKNRYHQINGKTVEVKGCDEQDRFMKNKRDTPRFGDQQQRIQSVVPAVQAALPQYAYQAQAQALQYQLAGLSAAAAAQPATAGAGYTVIPAGYSYDPTTGMVYQAAVPAQTQLAAAGQMTGQQQLAQLLQQQQLAGLQFAGQQYALAAAPGSAAVASVAQSAPAYQQMTLGQYSQESSAFGAQRILQAAAGGANTQLTTADGTIYQPAASVADQNAALYAAAAAGNPADQRSSGGRSSFHPYGR